MLDAGDKPLEDREFPDDADLDAADDADLESCGACGEMIYAGVAQCPYCREWTVGASARRPGPRRVGWAIAIVVAAVAAAALILKVI